MSDDYLIELCANNKSITLINRCIPEIADRCIYLDNELGGYFATKTLLENGHKDIAYISGPLWKTDAKQRLTGHKRALAQYQQNFSLQLLYEGDYQEASGGIGIKQLLHSQKRFSAVVCGNDEMASGAMSASRDIGTRLPEQLSIIGFDDVIFARHLFPKLSTVHYPITLMGQMASNWVLKHIYDQTNVAIQNRFDPVLIKRSSVARVNSNSKNINHL